MDNKKYQEGLISAMEWLGKRKNTLFLGQTVGWPGSPMFKSLIRVNSNKRMEMPVFENTQMGLSIGLALNGFVPISIFPRQDFLICAIDQLVNHLDKIESMSRGQFKAGVIIRTQTGNSKPLNPGPQHMGDYFKALKLMCKNVKIVKVVNPIKDYKKAYFRAKKGKSTLLIDRPTGVWKA